MPSADTDFLHGFDLPVVYACLVKFPEPFFKRKGARFYFIVLDFFGLVARKLVQISVMLNVSSSCSYSKMGQHKLT